MYCFKVRFAGAIDKPMEMTVEYIKANFKEITIPVTLVCAGNRRKEENMIKQGLGYVTSLHLVSTEFEFYHIFILGSTVLLCQVQQYVWADQYAIPYYERQLFGAC